MLHLRIPGGCPRRLSVRYLSSLISLYRDDVRKGLLVEDSRQVHLLERLEDVTSRLDTQPPPLSWFSRIFSASSVPKVKGLYVFGGVGCGKTMIMDMFYQELATTSKLRTHFHDFMLDVHERIHAFKSTLPPSHVNDRKCYDPIPVVAREIAKESRVLCFDEFQVTDVADAMILKRLFHTLFEEGVTMVATGNRPPEDLYKNGLQRSNFLPFIPMLKAHCEVLDMESIVDYRISEPKPLDIPGGRANYIKDPDQLDKIFHYLTGGAEGAVCRPVPVLGREIRVGVSVGPILSTTYRELIEQSHGSSDFRALARTFSHVIIKDFPQLSIKEKTQLRRFIVMMDIFYDRNVKLIISSDVPLHDIICLQDADQKAKDELRMLMDDLKLTMEEAKSMSLFTGEDEVFSQKRALSRLTEMQCADYWDLPHNKHE